MTSRYDAADLSAVTPTPFADRRNRVSVAQFGEVLDDPPALEPLLAALPDLLAAASFRAVLDRWVRAIANRNAVVVMCGGHVVKTGLSPLIADLLERGWITHLAFNGATAIHDFEIACFGETSEDVAENLADGSFGLADETGRWMAEAAAGGADDGLGLGEALGRWLVSREPAAAHADVSLLARAWNLGVPVTVHVALGAEIIHQHPACDGAVLGETSHRDFRVLAASLRGLSGGGLVANIGSAVVLPEVFVKALNVARHLWPPLRGFTAVNFDMLRHYRPTMNVTGRPVLEGGEGFEITGHHEIMIPLLYYGLRSRLGE